jgi:hypothetical protein
MKIYVSLHDRTCYAECNNDCPRCPIRFRCKTQDVNMLFRVDLQEFNLMRSPIVQILYDDSTSYSGVYDQLDYSWSTFKKVDLSLF